MFLSPMKTFCLFTILLMNVFIIVVNSQQRPVSLSFMTDRISIFAMQDAVTAYKLIDNTVKIQCIDGLAKTNMQSVADGIVDASLISLSLDTNIGIAHPDLNTLPLMAAAIVPIYRIDAIGSSVPLILSRQVLASIYMGDITWWNDSAIIATNPSVVMPKLPITVVVTTGEVSLVQIFTQAFAKFHPNFTQVIQVSQSPTWPINKYQKHISAAGLTGVGSAVIANDGTIGMAVQSVAMKLQVNTASLINKAGKVVRASSDSVTFAAVELGTALTLDSTNAADLTDCSASSGWPIATFTYILIDLINSRGTCHARAETVKFFINFYQSPTVTALLKNRDYAPVPSIVMAQLDTINQLGQWVKCHGQSALQVQPTTVRTMSVPSQLAFLANLFASVYTSKNKVSWELDVNEDKINLERLLNSEVDLAIVNPATIDPVLYQQTLNDPDYLVLPAFAFAWTWVYNVQLNNNVSIASQTLVLDVPTIAQLFGSCITNWNDSHLLTLNPWLSEITNNASIPIQLIGPCLGSKSSINGHTFILSRISDYIAANPSSDSAFCINNFKYVQEFLTCKNVPEVGIQWTQTEAVSSSLVAGTNAGMGYFMANGDSSFTTPIMRTYRNGISYDTKPDISGVMACAYDTYNPFSMSFDLASSSNTSCFPWTQQFVIVARRQYYSALTVTNTSSCNRGLDSLQMLEWLFSNVQIDALTNSVGVGRLTNVPGVRDAYIKALNYALCDSETLLITLPIIWELNSGIAGFGNAAAVVGFLLTSVLMGFTVIYRRHPVIRAASPLFMLVSLFGVIMMFAGAVALVSPVSTISCSAVSWLINLGIMVTFAPLFAKTWRIYRIFGRKKLSVIKISNKKLMIIIGVLLGMETILMIVWQALSPLQPYVTSKVEGSPSRVHEYEQCGVKDEGSALFAVVGVEKGLLLFFGALMAFSTRRVSSQFNESSQVALAIYNVVFSIGIIAPIIFVINATGDVMTALLLFVLLWISFFTACILVIPKALHILSPQNADVTNASIAASSGNSQSGYSFLSMDILSTVAVATGYLAALRNHVTGVEKHISAMKRSAGRESVTMTSHVRGKTLEKSLLVQNSHNNNNDELSTTRNYHNNDNNSNNNNNSINNNSEYPTCSLSPSDKRHPAVNRALHIEDRTSSPSGSSASAKSSVINTASVNSVNPAMNTRSSLAGSIINNNNTNNNPVTVTDENDHDAPPTQQLFHHSSRARSSQSNLASTLASHASCSP